MAISISCSCGKQYRLNDELAGKKAKCGGCGNVLAIPAAATATPAVATSATLDPGALRPRRTATANSASGLAIDPKALSTTKPTAAVDPDQDVLNLFKVEAPKAADESQATSAAPKEMPASAAKSPSSAKKTPAADAQWEYVVEPPIERPKQTPAWKSSASEQATPKPAQKGPSAVSRWWSNAAPGLLVGGLMMIGAAVWFGLGYSAGYIFFYPFFLFAAGFYKAVNGLLGD